MHIPVNRPGIFFPAGRARVCACVRNGNSVRTRSSGEGETDYRNTFFPRRNILHLLLYCIVRVTPCRSLYGECHAVHLFTYTETYIQTDIHTNIPSVFVDFTIMYVLNRGSIRNYSKTLNIIRELLLCF